MNKPILTVLILLLAASTSHSQSPPMDTARKEELRALLFGFPDWQTITQSVGRLRWKKGTEAELKYATDQIAKAKERLPKIRSYFKEGTSIFDYPGILEAGKVQLRALPREDGSMEYGYQVILGVKLGEEFQKTDDFFLEFDSKGIITKIGSLIATY